jgi:hypothetical protein
MEYILEILWSLTLPSFYGGNLTCKTMKFLQLLGPYLRHPQLEIPQHVLTKCRLYLNPKTAEDEFLDRSSFLSHSYSDY